MKKGTRVLYMSDQYDRTTMTPLHVFAWFCRADGLFEEDLDIPIPDEKFFHLNDPDINRAGLITVKVFPSQSAPILITMDSQAYV